MSAIVGLLHLDGRSVERHDLQAMLACVDHRGPDDRGVWHQAGAPVGLGHCMLWTTPESLHEKQPLTNATGAVVLVADARIDNREELIGLLEYEERPHESITDSELILSAYERWGEQCPQRLIGDFAFVIWDGRRQSLFCARDHFGVKPFYYYLSETSFFFGSEIKAILSLTQVPRILNEVRVADYLAQMLEDPEITFYEGIKRLPPAHVLKISPCGTDLTEYWALDLSREIRFDSDEEYADAFRKIFLEAVRCRLRSAFPVGSLLSGGIDSASVTCVAHDLLSKNDSTRDLHTFSGIFDEVSECDERVYFKPIVEQGRITPHYLHGDRLSPLTDEPEWMIRHMDEPFHTPGMGFTWELYRASHRAGMRVLLTGDGGDETVSHGELVILELARAGRWLSVLREARASAGNTGTPGLTILWDLLKYYKLGPLLKRSLIFRLARRVRRILLGDARPSVEEISKVPPWGEFLNPDFRDRIKYVERYRVLRKNRPGANSTVKEAHYKTLKNGLQPFVMEVRDKVSSAFSIEARYPFWDKRLVEFCLALPTEQKIRRGWGRLILRRAMDGIIPPSIQWRPDKTDFFPNFYQGLLTHERERLQNLFTEDPEIISNYVAAEPLCEFIDRFVSDNALDQPGQVLSMWAAASLGLWLRPAFDGKTTHLGDPLEVANL